jgi:putative MATE family efflux protein
MLSKGGKAAARRDWTKGSITRNLFSLTWPVLVTQGINWVYPVIDMIWVAKLGAASVAGVGIAGMVVILGNSVLNGLLTSMRALIARFVGAGDNEGANHVARQTVVIGVGYSVVVAAVGLFLAEPILRLFGVEPDVVTEGAKYLRISFVSSLVQILAMMAQGIMQASGDIIKPMNIAVISRIFHTALCPFLVFGWWIAPNLGVSGAAVTNIVSQFLALILGMGILLSGRTRLRLTLKNFRLDLNIIWRMLKVGIPVALMNMQHHLSTLVFIWFISPFGTLAVAAHSLWQRVDTILQGVGIGVGIGAGVLGAQNLGANQPGRAEKSGWIAAGLTTTIMIVGSGVLLLWAEKIAGIFTTDHELIKITSNFLRIATAGYFALGINMMFMNFLTSVGDTPMAMLGEMIRTWGVQVPLAFFLPKITNLGVNGVRWAMVAGTIVGGIIFILYFRLGRWKRARV